MLKEYARKIIAKEEGFRSIPYYCSEGYPTYGYGFRIKGTAKNDPLPNLSITVESANLVLDNLFASYINYLSRHPLTEKMWHNFNDDRRAVLLSMIHQVGDTGILAFRAFIKASEAGDYGLAAYEMFDSKAYRQSRDRWTRQCIAMASGEVASVPYWGC